MEKYVAPIEGNEFYAKDLVEALAAEGVTSIIGQSGGGTATLYVRLDRQTEDGTDYFLIGPGSYNWTDPGTSILTTDDLSCGEDGNYHEFGRNWDIPPGTTIPAMAKLIADAFREVNKAPDMTGLRTTEQMEDIIAHSTGPSNAGNWDELLGSLEHKPVAPFYLTDHIATDECYALVFSNGLVIRIWHPETGPLAFNGDVWDVTPLGWA